MENNVIRYKVTLLISLISGYTLKLYFHIICVFPVPVPIYIICDYYIHKTASGNFRGKSQFPLPLE